MNYDLLNQMIEYIENHLTDKIEYSNLAKIIGTSEYTLQRLFNFLTNISLAEYIRKRRLSRAYEDIINTDERIIDIAVKYQYDSSISFARAFKNLFGISPSECRKSNKTFKLFPIIKFDNLATQSCELKYEIKDIDEQNLYCFETRAKTHEDLLYNIRKLYKELESGQNYKIINSAGMYGISVYKNDEYIYYIGSTKELNGTTKFTIPKGKYAVFNVESREQKDIVNTFKVIYTQWTKSTNYIIDEYFCFEYYEDNNCLLYMLLKDKQN